MDFPRKAEPGFREPTERPFLILELTANIGNALGTIASGKARIPGRRTPTSPDALFALPAAIWVRDANAHRPWRLGEREIEPTAVLAVNDYLHLRQRAIAGDVVTELPPFLAAEALRDGRLVALLPDHPFPEQEVSLLYQRQLHPSRVVRAYLDYCQRAVGRYLASA